MTTRAPAGDFSPTAAERGSDSTSAARRRRALRLHHLTSAVVALIWLGYALAALSLTLETRAPVHFILLLRNTALTVMFLVRRPALKSSRSVKEWAVAIASTFGGYFFSGGSMVTEGVALPIMVIAGVLMTASITALGRSFGIVPANRGIKTEGPYRIVRHPIYTCYVLFDIGYLVGAPTARNAIVFLLVIVSLYWRARYEERILREDPAYRSYAYRTPSMFIPGLV